MAFTLDNVVPWGRSYDEYKAMFDLTEKDLSGTILGCSDGPASFNCEMTRNSRQCVSVDPIYQWSADQIQTRINQTFNLVMDQMEANKDEFNWGEIKSIEELGSKRKKAMELFLLDFERGKKENRYLAGELPSLHFADKEFDLALCSHFLFLYSEQLSFDFHIAAIQELCRVAKEIRIFPLLELGSLPSRHIEPFLQQAEALHLSASVLNVPYEFQKNGNTMLVIRSLVP